MAFWKKPMPDLMLPPGSDFGKKLNFLMLREGMTYKKVGELVGRSSRQIFRYCSGELKPRIDIVGKLAKVFEVSPEWLLRNDKRDERRKVKSRNV